jgi:exopolyphosphatase/guanosine-5'-triphosphate,3'-diphosphate pyrophosphatase
MRVGAIDVGSNSVRLLVADVAVRSEGGVRIDSVARAGEPCRLGRGLGRSGVIDEEMARRAVEVVGEFARRARSLGAANTLLAATAALRNAANGLEVAARLEAISGVPARILTGDDEARLVYQAVIDGLGPASRRSPCVVFDIGGGSTEVVSGLGEQPGRWTSLPVGAVSLTEQFLHSYPPVAADVERCVRTSKALVCSVHMPQRTPILAGWNHDAAGCLDCVAISPMIRPSSKAIGSRPTALRGRSSDS